MSPPSPKLGQEMLGGHQDGAAPCHRPAPLLPARAQGRTPERKLNCIHISKLLGKIEFLKPAGFGGGCSSQRHKLVYLIPDLQRSHTVSADVSAARITCSQGARLSLVL